MASTQMPAIVAQEHAYYDVLAATTNTSLERREQLFADLSDELERALFGRQAHHHNRRRCLYPYI